MKQLDDGDEAGHVVAPADVADRTAAMAVCVTKDAIPHRDVAQQIANLAQRVASAGKELHVILAGCNTIQVVGPLHTATPAEVRSSVWVVCTDSVWPSDLAPFLWHHYGGLVQKGDLQAFRSATRKLLGEYTEHYHRQRIDNESIREARGGGECGGMDDSLANAALCDRLDRVTYVAGGTSMMAII